MSRSIETFIANCHCSVRGIFQEGPGVEPGDGTDMEELKDYVCD